MWDTLKNVPRIIPSQAPQPETITRKLKSFQLEGLDWMTKQEQSQWKGGLLGDEMGMGKTIQAVSLIMSDYPANDPTLVVVPPVALMQWQNEINEYTNGKLKVLVYHNTNPKVKNMKVKDLRAFDTIMISYSGLESTYRKESKGWKRDDGLVKENSKIHAIKFHRLILDEAHNIKSRTTGGKNLPRAARLDSVANLIPQLPKRASL
jgi:DNA repair protein RAD16